MLRVVDPVKGRRGARVFAERRSAIDDLERGGSWRRRRLGVSDKLVDAGEFSTRSFRLRKGAVGDTISRVLVQATDERFGLARVAKLDNRTTHLCLYFSEKKAFCQPPPLARAYRMC